MTSPSPKRHRRKRRASTQDRAAVLYLVPNCPHCGISLTTRNAVVRGQRVRCRRCATASPKLEKHGDAYLVTLRIPVARWARLDMMAAALGIPTVRLVQRYLRELVKR